jgi:hypothetical protein
MNISLNWVALKTLVRKEVIRVLRIWIQTIVPPAITMTLYFIIFGNLIGKRIGDMGGFDYMQYIAPGLIMMSVITNSYGNVVSSFFGAKFGGHVEEMLVSPMSNATIIVGHVAGGEAVVHRAAVDVDDQSAAAGLAGARDGNRPDDVHAPIDAPVVACADAEPVVALGV